jgi:hypothetical protein|tara:strand:- start:347 stop:838 length:492 start_codon:yes stop_codon:yes gene_type:complete
MAHYAKLNENNLVLKVETCDNQNCLDSNNLENEEVGRQYMETHSGWSNWKKTSYNTKAGKHYNDDGTLSDNQDKAFRKNYAQVGGTYDPVNDAFINIKPYDSWILNQSSFDWEAPVVAPSNGPVAGDSWGLSWDEDNTRWIGRDLSNEDEYYWDSTNSSWHSL